MAVDRAPLLDRGFTETVRTLTAPEGLRDLQMPIRSGSGLDGRTALLLFESQVIARHLDLESRQLKRRGTGFYTIGSLGHEGNVVLGRLLRKDDPAFLHYRSGALMAERARQIAGATPIFDVLLSLVASSDDPVSGGRHKVFGSVEGFVPPQTSTIASHLPKAVGCAFAIERARALRIATKASPDAIVLCTFGDASVNHSVAQGAFNAASWAVHQRLPVPILFVCEDNGIGISVRTPSGWIESRFSSQVGLNYFRCDGLDLTSAYDVAKEASEFVRETRQPAFLHMRTVRLLGHAGSDVETEYLEKAEIERNEAADPLVATARLLVSSGISRPDELLEIYESVRARVAAGAKEAETRPKLTSAAEVIASLAPRSPDAVAAEAARADFADRRRRLHGDDAVFPETQDRPRHLAVQLNRGLLDLLAQHPELLIFGEDVAKKGGVYHVTTELSARAGVGRVFNTLLDETTILGLAIGAAHMGFLPMPEIQYLAYFHNAEDQIRSEACSLQFFSKGAFRNPMVMRIASFAYQRGFGGHFHNDNSIAVLRDIPGLIIAAPSRGDDAVRMLRTCVASAKINGSVVAFLEPIALYMMKDLHADGDGLWQTNYPPLGDVATIGHGRVYGAEEGKDLTIITYANGVWLSLRASKRLEDEFGLKARIIDLRWLAPMDRELVLDHSATTGRVLIVDEGRRSAGISEAIWTMIAEGLADRCPQVARVTGEDTYIPLGPAANEVLPTEKKIVDAAVALCARQRGGRVRS